MMMPMNRMVLTILLVLLPMFAHGLTLSEGLKIVAESGRDVSLARSEEESARENISLARAPWLPVVDLYGRETLLQYQPAAKTPFGAMPTSQEQFLTYGIRATQLLYDFGRSSAILEAAQSGLKARTIETEAARNRASYEFAIAYLDLLESEKMLRVAKEEAQLYEAHKKDTEARFRAGVVTRNEVLQAEVVLVDSNQRALTVENAFSLRTSRINSLLQKPLNDAVVAVEITARPSAGMTLEQAWSTAEAESPDLRDLDAKITARQQNVAVAETEYKPTFTLAGGYENSENKYQVHPENWSIVASVQMNLYAGGASDARVKVAKSEVQSLRLARDKLLDAVRLAVKAAWLELQSSTRKIEVTKSSVAQAEENLRLQRLRYQEGVGTATEVLDAVTLLSTAETNAWRALYGMKRAEANLIYATGRDLAVAYAQ